MPHVHCYHAQAQVRTNLNVKWKCWTLYVARHWFTFHPNRFTFAHVNFRKFVCSTTNLEWHRDQCHGSVLYASVPRKMNGFLGQWLAENLSRFIITVLYSVQSRPSVAKSVVSLPDSSILREDEPINWYERFSNIRINSETFVKFANKIFLQTCNFCKTIGAHIGCCADIGTDSESRFCPKRYHIDCGMEAGASFTVTKGNGTVSLCFDHRDAIER